VHKPPTPKKKQPAVAPPKKTQATPNPKMIFLIKILVACQAQNCVAQKAANCCQILMWLCNWFFSSPSHVKSIKRNEFSYMNGMVGWIAMAEYQLHNTMLCSCKLSEKLLKTKSVKITHNQSRWIL